MDDLDRGVLDDVGDELGGDLLGDDQALAVGADLGQQPGEHLHRVRGRAASGARRRLAQQPVRLLDHGQVPQPGRGGPFGALPHPQELGEPQQHRARQECLVAVVAAVLDLQHDVARRAAGRSPAGGRRRGTARRSPGAVTRSGPARTRGRCR